MIKSRRNGSMQKASRFRKLLKQLQQRLSGFSNYRKNEGATHFLTRVVCLQTDCISLTT